MQEILPHRCRGAMRERVSPCALGRPCERREAPEEPEEGGCRQHHHHHQLNGLLSPGHLKSPPRTAPNGLDPALSSGLAACSLREEITEDTALRGEQGDLSPALRGDTNHVPEEQDMKYVRYESELQMPDIMRLITRDLSEPYSIYTYRYFIHNWPQLCFLAVVGGEYVGAIVCKLDMHKKMFRRGYIAMLAVDSKYRRKGIGTNLVKKAIYAMVEGDCDEVVLETEITNKSALKLYENLGFVRDKRLFRYYLNGVDALRLKLWLR
ncbi:N-alpha-acetyltransferase 30 [Discoglossus pictus]